MTSHEMMAYYGEKHEETKWENLLERSRKLNELDPSTFKYLPFLEESTLFTEDAYCVMEQCVAIEKGWA